MRENNGFLVPIHETFWLSQIMVYEVCEIIYFTALKLQMRESRPRELIFLALALTFQTVVILVGSMALYPFFAGQQV